MSVHNLPLSQPVQWSEGMLLSPQHFQQNDKYWGQQLCGAMAIMQPHYYGISTLEIDHSELMSGSLIIKAVSGVLPDGLLFDYPIEAQGRALKRDLESDFINMPEKQRVLHVYLQVPRRGTAAAKNDSPQQRFIPQRPEEIPDENTGLGAAEVGRLVPNLSLTVVEPTAAVTYIRLMSITKKADGTFQVEKDYPAMLNIAAFRHFEDLCLQRRLRKLRDNLRERTRQLVRIVQASRSSTDREQRRRYSHIVAQLVKALPLLDIYQDSPDTHPSTVYSGLAVFLGQLSSINPSGVLPPTIEGYKHTNSYAGFDKLLSILEKTVDRYQLKYSSLIFEREINADGDTVFSLLLNSKWIDKDIYIEAKLDNTTDCAPLHKWFSSAVICADDNRLRSTIEQSRTVGAARNSVEEVKSIELYDAKDSVLYHISNKKIKVGVKEEDVIRFGDKLKVQYAGNTFQPDSLVLHVANMSSSKS